MRAPGTPTATPWHSRRPLLLLALLGLVLAALLASQAPLATAGGKPMPASVRTVAGGKPMPASVRSSF
jgi:hypothetical protein